MDQDAPARAEYAQKETRSKLPLLQQQKSIAELHEVINTLTDRLNIVLTPVPEVDRNTGEDKATPSQSPLAEELTNNNVSIRKASTKINALLERLEV